MKIGINLLYLIPGVVGGTEMYAAGLLNGLAKIDNSDDFFVFVNRESANWPLPKSDNFKRIICPVNASKRSSRYFYEQAMLPIVLKKIGVQVIHSLGYVGPICCGSKKVVTLPDLNYIDLKDQMPYMKRTALKYFSSHSAKTADHVITISNFSKSEIIRLLNIESNKITVTHLGPKDNSSELHQNNPYEVLNKYHITRPYIAAFGGGAIHKNIPRLIQAFDLVRDKIEHNLIIIGHIPTDVKLAENCVDAKLRKRVATTGYVPEQDIIPLLRHADVFILPSLYEGFGLPVLEAQQAGVAVLSSSAASLPEIAGTGALYFDPNSAESMAETILGCLSDEALRSKLVERGAANLKKYSWEKAARETLQVFSRVLE